MNAEEKIAQIRIWADETEAAVRGCPSQSGKPTPVDEDCPKCGATCQEPCRETVRAEFAFSRKVTELVREPL